MAYRFETEAGDGEPRTGTIGRNADVCLLTGSPISRSYIRTEATAGRMVSRLMAIVASGNPRTDLSCT